MKSKKVLVIFVIILFIVVVYNSYVFINKKNILKYTENSIEELGYSLNDIESIEVQHFFVNKILGYNEWKIPVVFKKKINITVWYSYRDNQIIFEGVSSKPMLDKEDVMRYSQEYKTGRFLDIENEKYEFKAKVPISIKIKNDTITNAGVTMTIKNNSDQTYFYGLEYKIEKLENGKFVTVEANENFAWESVLLKIESDEEKEEEINFTYGYDKLENGIYRLVRFFTSEENIASSANVSEKVYAEFEIK